MEPFSLLVPFLCIVGIVVYGIRNAKKHGRDRPPWKNDERDIPNGKK